jgi:uncharacterized protein YprB with RNaseH-like and TPR domain
MSSFGKKLGRLPPLRDTPREGSSRAPLEPSPEPARDEAEPRPSESPLEQLRAKLAAAMGAREPVARPALSPSIALDELFAKERTSTGELHVAARAIAPGHRVGAASLASARDADPHLLALLALDPALAGCDLRRALYLDTETTGLAGGTGTVPFLIGLAYLDPEADRFVSEQLFVPALGEEGEVLDRLAERVAACDLLVTFNGKAFDLPLVRARLVMNRRPALPHRPHLDLLHVARRLHKHRLGRCTLTRIEAHVLGFERVGDVEGAEIASIYLHFLRTGDASALEPVVVHNALDVATMVALVGMYGEPLDGWLAGSALTGSDAAAAADVARRAGDLEVAARLAHGGVERGAGALGFAARARVAKARGDKARALADYADALAELDRAADDAGSARVRLELAKLYEHHARDYASALALVVAGTSEAEPRRAVREARVRRKLGGNRR